MAETQAQNKLGELFVDIGVGGLGKTLKALNSVSASFLLTKNAAQQAFTPLINITKQGASLATALSKISAETGLTGTKLLALKRFSDLNNVSLETLSGTLEGLQQKILGAKMGTDTASMQAFQLMQLDPLKLSEKDPIKAFDEVKKRIETLSPEVQTMALNLLGMNKELTYVYKRIDGSLEDNLNKLEQEYKTSEKQLKNLEEQQNKFNRIKVATEQIGLNIASWKVTPAFLEGLAQITEDIAKIGFLKTFFNKKGVKQDFEAFIKPYLENPYKLLPKSIRNTKFIMEQEDKHTDFLIQKELEKEKKKPSKIYIGDEEVIPITPQQNSKVYIGDEEVKTKYRPNTVLGATPILPGDNINGSTLPTLPTATATTNNNTSTVNITNYWNNQFEWIKEPEDMVQAADKLADQMGLSEYTNSTNI